MVEAWLLHARDQALRDHLSCGLGIDPIVIAIREWTRRMAKAYLNGDAS
jgi:hypothetical protein